MKSFFVWMDHRDGGQTSVEVVARTPSSAVEHALPQIYESAPMEFPPTHTPALVHAQVGNDVISYDVFLSFRPVFKVERHQ